jgi:hypothetical protein
MPAHPLARAVLAIAIAAATAGCGIHDPYRTATTTTSSPAARHASAPAADQRDPAPERGGTIPSGARAAQRELASGAGSPTPQAALARYAAAYLNWNAGNVIQVQRTLASISLGQARAQAQQAAASAARDPQLARSHVANHGQAIAIAPGQHAAAGQWVIVTSEQTTGDGDYHGLPPTLHVIYAQLTDNGQGWIVSEWQPQN